MIDDMNGMESKANEHETFEKTIRDLERHFTTTRRANLIGITTTAVALAIHFFFYNNAGASLTCDGLIAAIVGLHTYLLFRHRCAGSICDRFADQLQRSLKQQIRAGKLYDLSIVDPLTGLHNRRFGAERLKEEIARADRSGEPLAVILFDLDYFKEINDEFGHAAGDLALKEFSRKLRKALRTCDVPVRIGGDEFLLILPQCPRENVDAVLSRIGSPKIELKGHVISVRYSVGRAHYQVQDTTGTLLGRADKALYAQKAARGNPVANAPKSSTQTLGWTGARVDIAGLSDATETTRVN